MKKRFAAAVLALLLGVQCFFVPLEELHAETVSTNAVEEGSISANSLSEKSLSENGLSQNEIIEVPDPNADLGYEIQYALIDDEVAPTESEQRQRNQAWNGFIADASTLEAGMDYIESNFAFEAASRSEAEKIVDIYGGKLLGFSYGIGEMVIPETTTEEVMAACTAAVDAGEGNALPAIYPNEIVTADETVSGDTIAEEPANEINAAPVELTEQEVETYKTRQTDVLENSKALEDIPLALNEDGSVSVIGDNFYQDTEDFSKLIYGDTNGWQHIVNGDYSAWNTAIGYGISVAVIDSGASTAHADIPYSAAYNAFSVNYTGSSAYLYSYYYGGSVNGALDNHGHGTHVAGIIAARGGNGGVCGVAPGANIISIKALEYIAYGEYAGSAAGSSVTVARAINIAVAKGARIINMSLGGGDSTIKKNAVDAAANKGCVIVAAAGNDGGAYADQNYPAAYDNTISVAATKLSGSADQIIDTSYSNTGASVDVAAPGSNIYSTYPSKTYSNMSGTSMATPMVSGALALYLENNKELLAVKDSSFFTIVKNALTSSAVDKGTAGRDNSYGYGVLSTKNLVNKIVTLAKPRFSINGGSVQEGYGIQMFSSNGAASIYYTMDGSTPTVNSLNYDTEKDSSGLIYFPMNATAVTLKAISIVGTTKSVVTSAAFSIVPNNIKITTSKYAVSNVLSKTGYFRSYSYLNGYTNGQIMPYQLYTITLNPMDSLNASLTASGFNGELYLLTGSTMNAYDVREYTAINAKANYVRTAAYTNTSAAAQDITIVVTSGQLLYGQPLGTVAGKGGYVLKTEVARAPQSITIATLQNYLIKGKSMATTTVFRPFDTQNQKIDWKLYYTDHTEVPASVATVSTTGTITIKDVTAPTGMYLKAVCQGRTAVTATKAFTAYPPVTKLLPITKIVNLTTNGFVKTTNAATNFTVEPANTLGQYTYITSNAKVATVSNTGLVTAVGNGQATITIKALDGSGKATAFLVNVSSLVTTLTMNPSTNVPEISGFYPIPAGTAILLNTSIQPVTASNKGLEYTAVGTLPAGVTLTGNKITVGAAVAPNTTFRINVRAKDISGIYTGKQFKVYACPTKIVLSGAKYNLNTVNNSAVTITSSVQNKAGLTTGIVQTVNWSSSNEKVAKVSAAGTVTAVGKGSAVIKAITTDGSKISAAATVSVIEGVTSLTIMPAGSALSSVTNPLPLLSGRSTSMVATALPLTANNRAVSWSVTSAPAGVIISSTGVVSVPKTVTSGSVTIKAVAKDGILNNTGASGTKAFTIYPSIQKVTLADVNLKLNTVTAKTTQMSATVTPVTGVYTGVTWRSSNVNVATVSETGLVTAVAKGSAAIIATAKDGSGLYAAKTVTVVQPMTSFTIENKTGKKDASGRLILISGANTLLLKDILPLSPTNKNVTWSFTGDTSGAVTINPINGTVNVSADKAVPNTGITIKATVNDSGYSVSKTAVIYPSTKAIYLSKTELLRNLHIGESLSLSPTCNPVKAYNQINGGFEYVTSNSKVATVNAAGVVTAVSKGVALITVKATDGSNKTAVVVVYIYN
jgi:subtilisin family serine protease/uncharacterized protein YjdB